MGHSTLKQHKCEKCKKGIVPIFIKAPQQNAQELEEEKWRQQLLSEQIQKWGKVDKKAIVRENIPCCLETLLRMSFPLLGVE
mmetsp:Transcript_21732/g.33059  ORF Transcript_21732/g.33059 Transcript_21732/m.33059 type:complete len:82 (+) Transcript_21732:882-1127(+)